MSHTSRRTFLGAGAAASLAASAIAISPAHAAAEDSAPATNKAFEYQHVPRPLPFQAKNLKGLSERLVQSHWENNYAGAVKALNVVRGRLVHAMSDTELPPYLYNGLKREQLLRSGSVSLHELYFDSLGGSGDAPADVRAAIGRSFGTHDVWESEFRKIGAGLGGGSGWVVLAYNHRLGLLENYWMADHSTSAPDSTPVLVMDMYEHAYQMDYGAAAAKYIDAFFVNIQWDAVARRLEDLRMRSGAAHPAL